MRDGTIRLRGDQNSTGFLSEDRRPLKREFSQN